ncbi:MAG: SprT family zinc-dependent metalloprotease [Pseudomonadota bacterium]
MSDTVFHTTLSGNGPLFDDAVPVTVKVNRRAKRIILRVDEISGDVIATAPSKAKINDAVKFANEKAAWIKRQRSKRQPAHPFVAGRVFPFCGNPVRIVLNGGPRQPANLHNGQLEIGGDAEHVNRRVTEWLKRKARSYLSEKVDHYTERLGAKHGPIRIKDTRSRWGSCASDGTIAFSWRIIMAPRPIIDYVAAHECAHLIHMNHSPAFWQLVESLDVDAGAAREWFNRHGTSLFVWGAI